MYSPLNVYLGNVAVIEQDICDRRDENQDQARGCEKEGAQVCSLGWLGDSSMDRYERCVLRLSEILMPALVETAYHSFAQR